MSLLLGVRGADHKTRGQSFQENIRQQPGSYYNANTSSHSNESSLQNIWHELPPADEILSRSSTAVHLVPLTSATSKTSSGLKEEKHWQDTIQRDTVRGEDFNPLKAEGHRHFLSNVQPNASTYRSSDTPILPLSSGYSPQSELLSNDNMSSFTFSAKSSQDFSKNGKSTSDEKLRCSDMEPISAHKNEKSWKLGGSDPETKSSLRGSSDSAFFTQRQLNSEAMTTHVLENDALKCPGAYKSTCIDATDSKHTFTEKKTPEIFVFGASVSGGRNSFKSSAPEQKFFQSSFARPSARSRISKFKRSSTLPKGKGLASSGGSAIQQSAPTFSREVSPESFTGLGSTAESSQLDEAECSDAKVWEKDDRDERIDCEEDEVLESHYRQEENSGAGTQNRRRGLLDGDDQEKVPNFELNQQDYSFADPKAQENHTSHPQETQTLSARFGSWWPFKVKTDKGENWMVDDSSKTFQDLNISTQSGNTLNEPKTNFERHELSDMNPSTTPSKPSERNLQCSLDGFEEVTELSDVENSDLKISGKFNVKEPTQNSGDGSNDSIWGFGGKDHKQPFVFGASQHEEDYSGENMLRRSGTTAPDEDLQEGCQGLNPGSSTSTASEMTSSSTAFSSGMTFGTTVYKGSTSMNNHTCLQSPVFTTCTPVTGIRSNSDLLMKGVKFPSFTEPEKRGPTGEFSGPLSCSESSASESSPSRTEPWQASDKPFNQMPCFKFQGNFKDESSTSYATGKNKSGTASRVRRHVRGGNRCRRPAQATSFKDMPTPMDVSPSMNDMESSSKATTLEQPCLNLSGSTSTDSGELLREPSNLQKMTHPASCSTRLNVGTDQSIPTLQAGKQVFENSNDWNDHSIFSSKRSGKWKRSGLDEGYNSLFQKTQGLTGHPEGGAMPTIDDQTLKNDTTMYEPIFTFGASSSHTSSNRFEPRPSREKPTEPSEELPADRVFVPDMPFSLDQNQHHQLKVGPVPTNLLASTNQNSASGVSRPLSNQNHTYVKSPEDAAAANMDSAHHVLDGMGNTNAIKSAAAEQVCERWRLRGNQAYAIGDFPKAEEYYSRGASSVSPNETSQSCIRASMLCYSNRAATRMAVGRMREALADCKRAMVVDPGFLRVRLRAASCHLALGESKAAVDMFKDCLKYAKENSKSDPKILVEAMEGVKKSQQLDEYSDRASELLQQQTPMDSTSALRLVNEALSISPFSEPLHELKTQALLSLRRYDECLQFCEQTLPAAERNHGYAVCEKHQDSYIKEACQSRESAHLKLWRWRLSAKALYNLGKLEESLELLVKHEEVLNTCSIDKCTHPDSLSQMIASIRDQLRHKVAGNEAFQLGKHSEAVEHYTAALACNGDSRPFNAVCFCNRAAAWQALGHIADAIADCSRAIALDAVYPKALSRRATLHEMIRDYGQACNDLRRLIALLEDQTNETSKGAGSTITVQDLRQAKERLERSEEEMKKGHPIDHYLVLGVDFSCSANEIKKAYRKAALKHHPDKAGQFLARSETGDDGGLWNEMNDEVCRDAERLFKLIGEAYGILSDGTKRLRYDTDEENRKLRGKDGGSQVPSSFSDGYRPQYETSSRRQQRDRWDAWQGFGPQHQRWQSGPDAAQPDTYGRRTTGSGDSAKAGKTTWNADFFWDKL